MLVLHAISNQPLEYIDTYSRLTLKGISLLTNFSPKFIIVDKFGNPLSNANINLKSSEHEYDIISDDSGYVEINGNVVKNILYDMIVTCDGYQDIISKIKILYGFKENTLVMYKVNTLITTSNGYAVNLKPTDPENKSFN